MLPLLHHQSFVRSFFLRKEDELGEVRSGDLHFFDRIKVCTCFMLNGLEPNSLGRAHQVGRLFTQRLQFPLEGFAAKQSGRGKRVQDDSRQQCSD